MLGNFKLTTIVVATSFFAIIATITSPATKMFGKHYIQAKDFSCCKNNRLVIHHYYTVNLLWVEISDGYTNETTGKILQAGDCNIKCLD
ncbi:hypothetical protein [Parasediminibacterium sp. JCM 36343]|uniref:hypothetical protein n=1 Tax=Parasediminibacterium sp. JCM 36343 TaxID=3374279 RepID=UPI00397DE268